MLHWRARLLMPIGKITPNKQAKLLKMKPIFTLIYLFLSTLFYAQGTPLNDTYIEIHDATGYETRLQFHDSLNAVAKRLTTVFADYPTVQTEFKVLSGNFYRHNESMKNGIPGAMEMLNTLAKRTAPYYLLIGKESNEFGTFQRFWVSLKLPDEPVMSCFDATKIGLIEEMATQEMNRIHELNQKRPYRYAEAEIAGINTVKGLLKKFIDCCPAPNARFTPMCTCIGMDTMTTNLVNRRGMLYFDVEDVTTTDETYSTIDAQKNILLTNNGYSWNITDELAMLANGLNAAKDSIKVRYFDDVSCAFIFDYLDGKEDNPAVAARNSTSDFFHEVIVLSMEGKHRVFFRFSEEVRGEILDKWALKLTAVGKPSGLYYMAANLFFEKCLRNKTTPEEARNDSETSSFNWLKVTYSKTEIDFEYSLEGSVFVSSMTDYLLAANLDFTLLSLEGFNNKTAEEIARLVNRRPNSWLKLIDDRNFNIIANQRGYYKKCGECLDGDTRIIAGKFQYEGNVYYKGEKGSFTCLTPTGHLFNLPKNATAAFNVIQQDNELGKWPLGALVAFKIGNDEYEGRWYSETGHFLGYALDGVTTEEEIYANSLTYANGNRYEVYAAKVDGCTAEIIKGGYAATDFLKLNPKPDPNLLETNPKIINELLIGSFVKVEEDTFYTRRCLGDIEWCKAQYTPPTRSLHPYLEQTDQSVIGRIVKENPCLLEDMQSLGFTPYSVETEWMKAVKDLAAMGTAYAFTPIAVEELLAKFLQEYGREKIRDATIAYHLDLLFQACIKFYFPANGNEISWDVAFQDLDQSQALFSASEALISLKNPYAEVAVTTVTSCLFDGFTEKGELRDGFSYQDCAIGAGFNILIQGILKGAPFAKRKLKEIPKPVFVNGLIRFFGDLQPSIHINSPVNLPAGVKFSLYSWVFRPDIKGDDVAAIFDISGSITSEIAEKISKGTAKGATIRNALLYSDLWSYIRTAVPDANQRKTIVNDIVNESGVAKYMNKNPDKFSHTEVFDQILAKGSVKKWMDDIIATGKRDGEPSLAKILDDFDFPSCGDAVKKAGTVSPNNKKGLDAGDARIPNAIGDYSYTRNGTTYTKGQTPFEKETWEEYFARLKNSGDFNEFQSHHIFPVNLFKKASFRKWYELLGKDFFQINGKHNLNNLIMLEQYIIANGKGVHTKHDAYTDEIGDYFERQWAKYSSQKSSDFEIAIELNKDIVHLIKTLKESLLENSVKDNIRIATYWDDIDFENLVRK